MSGNDLFLSMPHPPSSLIPRRRAALSTANIRPFGLIRPNILAVFGLTRPITLRMSSLAPIFAPSINMKKAMDTYALHLAMAALVGASFVAVSAYYMYRKTLSQLLEFAQAVEHERATAKGGDEDSGVGRDDEPKRRPSLRRSHQQHSCQKKAGYYRCGNGSASLLDVILAA